MFRVGKLSVVFLKKIYFTNLYMNIKQFLQHMDQKFQNLKLSSLLSANKQSKLDNNAKFLIFCGSDKENIMRSEMPPCNTNSFQKFKKYNCAEISNDKLDPDPKDQLETSQNIFKVDKISKRPEKCLKIKKELSKYRNELREFTNSTKDLEEKFTKMNSELNEMKQKNNYLITKRNLPCGDFDTFSDSSSGNEYSLQRKCTQIFHNSNSFIQILSNEPLKEINYNMPNDSEQNILIMDNHKAEAIERRAKHQCENKENVPPIYASSSYDNSTENTYFGYKSADEHPKPPQIVDVSSLKKTITKLQNDSERFCSIIEQQKNTLGDYRKRFVKAQHLVKEQRIEIEQLNTKNQQLEKDASVIIDELHQKIDSKLRDVDLLSDRMRSEQVKREYANKENSILTERIQAVEAEANQLKLKLEEMSRRKMATISRLKVAERDLKIFKNYNAALKQEKRKLNEEMKIMSEQLDNMQNVSKRTMNRHREQNEKQRRQLQKRILELEMKLNRSQNSTTSLIQERDSLIAELQSQLNNLVHNFEVSQKHIRVLRRHIYSMCGNNNRQSIIHTRSVG